MAPYRYARKVHYQEFVQRVRQHAPSSLLPLVAKVSAHYSEPGGWHLDRYRVCTPWNLAEVTRVSLAFGNEHRKPATEQDILYCCAACAALVDPDLSQLTTDGFAKFMLRLSGQQMGYQLPVRNELARSIALFEHTTTSRSLEVLRDGWAHDLLNCSVSEYVGVAFLFYVAALRNAGVFSLDWLDQENFAPLVEEVPADTIRGVAEQHFITTPAQFRTAQPKPKPRQHPDTWRYQFNPLEAHPVLQGVTTQLLTPVPSLLVRKVGLLGLYYTAQQRWGDAFTRDLGWLFEAYVGRQLDVIRGATVLPTIKYGRDNRESVDWLVLFDNVTLLIEVKSTRPTEAIRTGSDDATDHLKRNLSKAVNQISTTAQNIRNRHEAFRAIPHDRPIIGLIVTMEPFHVVNAALYRQLLPERIEPVRVCSAFELEHMVTVQDRTVGEILLEYVRDPERQDSPVSSTFESSRSLSFRRNAVIDEAFECLPWTEGQDAIQ